VEARRSKFSGARFHLRRLCVYDAPTPEAVRTVADRNGLPVDGISEVRILDPYFHR
jgi:hypothetical protein